MSALAIKTNVGVRDMKEEDILFDKEHDVFLALSKDRRSAMSWLVKDMVLFAPFSTQSSEIGEGARASLWKGSK